MKIGILTLPLHTNYGGILQAYALQTVLERMGHEVVVFNTPHKEYSLPIWKKPLIYTKRFFKKYICWTKDICVFYEYKANKEYPIISLYTQKFIEKYINVRELKCLDEIDEKEFNVIVVGSDQIWRPLYYPNIEDAYLRFTKGWNIKRIAYAASFGTTDWEYTNEQTKECGQLLRTFNAVSVREDSGINLCEHYFQVKASHVLDPTMLLDKEDYMKLFEHVQTPENKGILLCYILDENLQKKNLIEQIAKDKDLTPFWINAHDKDYSIPLQERIQPPVEQWLRGFYDAEFVVTDSFHACVFSILFRKQFVVIGNKKRGMSRFKSLLTMFGLEGRLLTKEEQYRVLPKIHYDEVYNKLKERRIYSLDFLSNYGL